MGKIILIFIGFLVLILALTGAAVWRLPAGRQGMPDLSSIESMQNLQDILPKEARGVLPPVEFTSPDGKFKIQYPADWFAVDKGELLGALTPPEWKEKYDLQTLLLAQNLSGGGFAQLIVYKGEFGVPVEEIFEKMKEDNEKQGWKIEVIDSNIKENEGIFESENQSASGAALHSKEKILTDEKDAHIISLTTLEKDWEALAEDIDKILESATIIGEEREKQ